VTAPRPDVRAQARFVRASPRKARLVVDQIRGRTVPEARTILAFTSRAVARDVEKVLSSAVANAEATRQWNGDELVISAAYVDEGTTIKRWRARARGRVNRILKRTCHITIKVEQAPVVAEGSSAPKEKPARRSRKAEGGAAGAAPKKSRSKKKKEVAA
jgi:large subunit ribosomal protein L22